MCYIRGFWNVLYFIYYIFICLIYKSYSVRSICYMLQVNNPHNHTYYVHMASHLLHVICLTTHINMLYICIYLCTMYTSYNAQVYISYACHACCMHFTCVCKLACTHVPYRSVTNYLNTHMLYASYMCTFMRISAFYLHVTYLSYIIFIFHILYNIKGRIFRIFFLW